MSGKARAYLVSGFGVMLAAVVIWHMNRGYGEVSERGYEISMALFSACNRKDAPSIQQLAEIVELSAASGELQDSDTRYLRRILRLATNNNWESAAHEARELLVAQVTPNSDLPSLAR